MNLPSGVPVFKLRDAIAEALWAHVKANRLAAVWEYLGLAPQQPDEDPYNSKRSYVHARLEDKLLPDLMAITRRVVDEYGDDDLQQLLAQMGLHGVSGELKNLIFAADGPKPQIVLPDSISNTIRIVKNEQYCLVYDQPLEDRGLSWQDLVTGFASTPSTQVTRHGRGSPCESGCGARWATTVLNCWCSTPTSSSASTSRRSFPRSTSTTTPTPLTSWAGPAALPDRGWTSCC
ncbi:hypothetical protein ACIRP3_41840 [Streptomyces sp. NPDC101209]|uniref:hypothetical protein n=1 Tax=Streptomyces sp. NPDC101209 TaxID=3366129 RepID=UPI003821FBCC